MKKLLSLFLCLCVLISTVSMLSLSASAGETDAAAAGATTDSAEVGAESESAATGYQYHLKVGDTKYLFLNENSINSSAWISNDPFRVEVISQSTYSCQIRVNEYPGSSAVIVQCRYNYMKKNPMTGYSFLFNGAEDYYIYVDKPEYTIKLDACGGYVSTSSFKVSHGDTYGSLPTPTRDGYAFQGWYTSSSGGNRVYPSDKVTESKTLYAHWTAVETRVTLDKSSVTVNVGKTATLKATVSPSNAASKSVTWSSSDNTIATVSSSGVVTGKKTGSCVITAKTSSGNTAKCTVKVVSIAVTKVTLNKTSAKIAAGKTVTLKATVTPSNASTKTVSWSTSNSSIATVSSKGVVTGKKAGTVTITAKSNNGKKASCKVTVTPVAVTKIALNTTSATIGVGMITTLKATFSPSNATTKTVTWSTSNKSIATVSSKGVVTGKKVGTVTITAKSNNGKKATCKIKVSNIAVTKVALNYTSKTVNVGKTVTLKATVSPSNAANKTIKWSSSNTSVATVSSKGVVTGKKAGTATITATSVNGKKATCKVTVKKAAATAADTYLTNFNKYKTFISSKPDDIDENGIKSIYSKYLNNSTGQTCEIETAVLKDGSLRAIYISSENSSGYGFGAIIQDMDFSKSYNVSVIVVIYYEDSPVVVSKATVNAKTYNGSSGVNFSIQKASSMNDVDSETITSVSYGVLNDCLTLMNLQMKSKNIGTTINSIGFANRK